MWIETLEGRTLCAAVAVVVAPLARAARPPSPFSRANLVGAYEGFLSVRRVRQDLDVIVTAHDSGNVVARLRLGPNVYEASGTATTKGRLSVGGVSPDVDAPGAFAFTGTVARNGVSLRGRYAFVGGVVVRGKVKLTRTSAEPRVVDPPVHVSTLAVSSATFGNGTHGWVTAAGSAMSGRKLGESTFAGRFLESGRGAAVVQEVRNFFVFELPPVLRGSGPIRVTGAALVLERAGYRSTADAQTYGLFEVVTDPDVLLDPAAPSVPEVFADLGDGPSYGTFEIARSGNAAGPFLWRDDSAIQLPLSAAALDAATAAFGAGGRFALGGRVLTETDPDPYFGGSSTSYDGLFFGSIQPPSLRIELEQTPTFDATTPAPR